MKNIIFYGAGQNAKNRYSNHPTASIKLSPPSLTRGLCFADMDSKK